MTTRRSFLRGLLQSSLVLPLATAAGACSPSSGGLRVRLLSQSVPVQVVGAFQRSLKPSFPIDFSSEARIETLFADLQKWQNSNLAKRSSGLWGQQPTIPDLVSLGDGWLGDAIRQDLIQPWKPETLDGLDGWNHLDDRYKSLVRRNHQGLLDDRGEIWALPYRWGTTAIAYRQDFFEKLGWAITDWSDLWRPELAGHIGLVDDPREVIGFTLKSLGQSYNAPQPQTIPNLSDRLRALHSQVKFYSSTHLVQPLLLKDVAVVVGWSADLLPLSTLDRQVKVVLPRSGTALWADLWVRPRKAPSENLSRTQAWVDFCWRSDMAPQFARFGQGTSPYLTAPLPTLDTTSVLYPDAELLARSEFLSPFPETVRREYGQLWNRMRAY